MTVYPLGTTIYIPEKCFNGYTVFSYEVGIPAARIIDMNGNIVNEISPVRAARAKLLKNGNILIVSGMAWHSWRKEGDVREYDWSGNLVWRYKPPGLAHHDVERLENGSTLLVYQEKVPKEYLQKVKDPKRRTTILSDVVLEVTPEKEIVWEYTIPYPHRIGRAQRVPYDYCPSNGSSRRT
ncbi:TPA: hypothetical protein EYP75_04725 [Candidatus Bathyarchaeota archaeon]|nr:hypothetical protein [Candidatus Bathyarchaeota archaeon]